MEAFRHQTELEQNNPSIKTITARGMTTRDPKIERATSDRLPKDRAKHLEQQELDLHRSFANDRAKTHSTSTYGKSASLIRNLHKKVIKIKGIYGARFSPNQNLSS